MSYIKRIYIVESHGIREVSRGTPSYDYPTLLFGIETMTKFHKRIEVGLSEYGYEKIICFVEPNAAARRNFMDLCRIAGRTPDNCVYAVMDGGGVISLHRTHKGATDSLATVVDEIGPGRAWLALEEIEE